MVEDEPLELPAREGQAAGRLRRDDLRDAWQPVDHRHLAEEVAGPEPGQLVAVADDPRRPLDDDEEAGPDLALAGDHVVGREVDLHRPIADRRQVVAR